MKLNPDSIELTPDSKREFDIICETFRLDKQTRLRAIYLFDEFLERRMLSGGQVNTQLYPTYLKIAALVSSKNAVVKTISGANANDPGIRLTSLLRTQNDK